MTFLEFGKGIKQILKPYAYAAIAGFLVWGATLTIFGTICLVSIVTLLTYKLNK